jgi:hypothetical protein
MKLAVLSGLLFSAAHGQGMTAADEPKVREFMNKTCAYHRCSNGDIAITSYSQGSPALACPTKELSNYANLVVTMAALGIQEKSATGEIADLMKSFRKSAAVANFEQAAKECWKLSDKQRVRIVDYAERGAVKVSPLQGGMPYWTQSNHLDRP